MNRQTKNLFKKTNVVSVGIGRKIVGGKDTGREAIVVGVVKKVPLSELSARDVIPKTIMGKVTDVVEVGEIKALGDDEIDRKERWRPAPGGVSVGHKDITAGTLGAWVRKGGEWLILSNNHVLANVNEAEIGDPILQPGAYDGGTVDKDTIGLLTEYVEIRFSGASDCPIAKAVARMINLFAGLTGSRTRLIPYREPGDNLVDCALARPLVEKDVDQSILECGKPEGHAEPELGMIVKKSGRTTGLTRGEVTQVEATVSVNMGDGRFAYFVDQFFVSKELDFSKGGDSGSLVMTEDSKAVGLLFAGSDSITVSNRFTNVRDELGVTL